MKFDTRLILLFLALILLEPATAVQRESRSGDQKRSKRGWLLSSARRRSSPLKLRLLAGAASDVTRDHPELVSDLETAADLGRSYFIHAQTDEGNFTYEYDWSRGEATEGEDNSVRQAGATWGIALLHLDDALKVQNANAALSLAETKWEKSKSLSSLLQAKRKRQGALEREDDKEAETSHHESRVKELRRRAELQKAKAKETETTLMRALEFFRDKSRLRDGGKRVIKYPGEGKSQKLGTVSLLAMAHVDALRAALITDNEDAEDGDVVWDVEGGDVSTAGGGSSALLRQGSRTSREGRTRLFSHRVRELAATLDELLHTVWSVYREDEGEFPKWITVSSGHGHGKPSPYFEGETLLLLVRAARYLGDYPELCSLCGKEGVWKNLLNAAESGWERNVEGIIDEHYSDLSDDDQSKLRGYYQWSSMAWSELLAVGDRLKDAGLDFDPDTFRKRLLRYASWNLKRSKGEHSIRGEAVEGLVPSYLHAQKLTGEDEREATKKLGKRLGDVLTYLNEFQVGHPRASGEASEAPVDDERAKGGVLGGSMSEPKLRIDVTQHQMHAVLLAKQMLKGEELVI